MYFDSKRNRLLLRDGRSLVDSFEYARRIIEGEDLSGVFVVEDEASRKYDLVERTNVSVPFDGVDVHPTPDHSNDIQHLHDVIEEIGRSPRFDGSDIQIARIDHELEFFSSNGHIQFIWEMIQLIKQFKEDGVVWGVGRGSSCASLIMFILEVNDVNPLLYDIPFSELSKVQESVYD